MRIEKTFNVMQSRERVWSFFQDVSSVADCLPGAEITGDNGAGAYTGRLEIKLGAIRAAFAGGAEVMPDPDSFSARIQAKGVDRSGGSRGQATIEYYLTDEEAGTAVTVQSDIALTGAIAQFGRTGLLDDLADGLIEQFVRCLEEKMNASTPEEREAVRASELHGFALLFAAVTKRLRVLIRGLFDRERK